MTKIQLAPTSLAKKTITPTSGRVVKKQLLNSNEYKKLELPVGDFINKSPSIDELLKFCTQYGCSDLMIKVGSRPFIFRYGILYKVPSFPTTQKIWNEFAIKNGAISSEANSSYVREKMYDFSYEIQIGGGESYRYRVSAGFSTNKNIATFRMISASLPTFKTLNIPTNMVNMLAKSLRTRGGITIIAGVTGSGKTSTLAACYNTFNSPQQPFENANVITLEDPIEYIYPSNDCTRVTQKELGKDFRSFANGIKQALREHPTHIEVGESRDAETIKTLIEASRTGHSVLTTFHTGSVADTLGRLIDHLSADNNGVTYDLITNINTIICQRLVPGNNGYKLEYEYLDFNYSGVKSRLIKTNEENGNVQEAIRTMMNEITNPEICVKY